MKLIMNAETPLHIGNGEILSPYSDYIYENGRVYYIDHNKLQSYIYSKENAEELMDRFINIVNIQTEKNTVDKYKLKDFLAENGINIEDYSSRITGASDELKNEEIHRAISTSNRPYVPGSSIKGAFRTALLYRHLLDKGCTATTDKKTYVGEDEFGSIDKDVLKFLHISDTLPLPYDNIEVVKTCRINISTGKATIPVIKEAIPGGTVLEFHLACTAKAKYHSLADRFEYLYEGGEKEVLVEVNNFYTEQLNREIDELCQKKHEKLDALINLYTGLYNKALQLKDTGEGAVLRLGSGKTFYDNSIASLFTPSQMMEIRSAAGYGNYSPFPSTRVVVLRNGIIQSVLGWVTVTVKE
ncbi:MAG: CRISPR-associated protein, Csm5 family [Firmicutes bacterium]|nr:CRISPR-associated protein, Csm5 family [Bacillota bacterium]